MAKNDPPAAPARKAAAYVVAAGISTVGKSGIVAEGKDVGPDDIEGGQKAFDELVARGVLVPKMDPTPASAEPEKKPDVPAG